MRSSHCSKPRTTSIGAIGLVNVAVPTATADAPAIRYSAASANVEITQLLFNNTCTIALRGYDLLNQAKNLSVTDSSNYHQEVRNNTLGRYIVISLTYRFGTFGGRRGGGPMMGPPGGGRGPAAGGRPGSGGRSGGGGRPSGGGRPPMGPPPGMGR